MKPQPDKIFSEKLSNFSKAVPPSAWDKIEVNLDRKTPFYWKLAVAASLILAVLISYTLWPEGEKSNQKVLTENKLDLNKHHTETTQIESAGERAPEKTTHSEPADKPAYASRQRDNKSRSDLKKENHINHDRMATEKLPEESAKENASLIANIAPEAQQNNETDHETKAEIIPQLEAIVENNITLVLTVEETNNYLKKNYSSTDATPEAKKSSTLKKMLKKANDLKSNQDPFGDLRQMKNEILALDFKANKQRGQNNK